MIQYWFAYTHSKHRVRVGWLLRDALQHIPVLHDLAVRIQAENVNAGPIPTRLDSLLKSGYVIWTFELTLALKSSLVFICILSAAGPCLPRIWVHGINYPLGGYSQTRTPWVSQSAQ